MIINGRTKRPIVERSRLCLSVFHKALGLMFSRPRDDMGLVFCFSREAIRPLHMLFVFYPIDVLFLDKDSRVVEIKQNLKPFWFYAPKNKSQYVIELPKGKASGCRIGDKIKFK